MAIVDEKSSLLIERKLLGLQAYEDVWSRMRDFTNKRGDHDRDELWLVEHPPVFTQGQAGKPEHILVQSDIPLVKSDRGGQVTYHGPGQIVAYPLLDLRRRKMGVRELVSKIEASVISFLQQFDIQALAKLDAPGVYVEGRKIASLGLRVRKGCSFHGVAINIRADLSPFQLINPCGYEGLEMVNLEALSGPISASIDDLMIKYSECLAAALGSVYSDSN